MQTQFCLLCTTITEDPMLFGANIMVIISWGSLIFQRHCKKKNDLRTSVFIVERRRINIRESQKIGKYKKPNRNYDFHKDKNQHLIRIANCACCPSWCLIKPPNSAALGLVTQSSILRTITSGWHLDQDISWLGLELGRTHLTMIVVDMHGQ